MCNLKHKKSQVKKNLPCYKIKKKACLEWKHILRGVNTGRGSALQLQYYHKLPVRLSANCPNCSKVGQEEYITVLQETK